jgi:hypothetical protein
LSCGGIASHPHAGDPAFNLSTAIHYNGNTWIANSGDTLAQIQSDIELLRLCAKCHPVYLARLAESLPAWRRPEPLSGKPPCRQPFQRGSTSPAPGPGMRP